MRLSNTLKNIACTGLAFLVLAGSGCDKKNSVNQEPSIPAYNQLSQKDRQKFDLFNPDNLPPTQLERYISEYESKTDRRIERGKDGKFTYEDKMILSALYDVDTAPYQLDPFTGQVTVKK